ncbi:hypothetical protein QCA50_003125 [Cerrena zonata]|uniref:Uncharacterized protein n=1 Tax=Cerrena zonata TaxID=2478898 RepID=A0AAW0GVJ1_9APHY
MSRQPILLWKPNRTRATDDAGTDISKYEFPVNIPGPYEEVSKLTASKPSTYVPSLRALCIRQLATYPDQLDWLGTFRVYYEKPKSPSDYDLVRSLVPGYSHENPNETSFLKAVDPRLWAAMIQIISPLPDVFRSYDIPLSDTHVPLLQQIPSTSDFSLITIVQLYGRKEVDDDTIDQLGALHSLVALDVGRTPLSSWGIERLSYTLLTDGLTGSRRGPWSLRVLYLWDCMFIESSVIKALSKFPLLSVVDLRGTKCKPSSAQGTCFGLPPQDSELYHPTPLSTSLHNLSALAAKADPGHPSRLFSHPKPYILHITTLHHAATKAESDHKYSVIRDQTPTLRNRAIF